ncbi:MAG: DNA replication/repair protein RecF [Rhodanobacteraceae bacterium]
MNIDLLRVSNLRCFERIEFKPGPGINWLIGPNGAGKTTLLEVAHILSHGRSFRTGGRAAPCRQGAHEYLVYAEVSRVDRPQQRLGLTRSEDRWKARLNGADLSTLAPLFATCPVVCFGPESQALILGGAAERRSFLDWSVFHVEHQSLDIWRMWRRTLRQRNALLRASADNAEFDPWERDLSELADRIHALRTECLASLEPYLTQEADWLVPELGAARIDYRPGWDESLGLARQLADQRERDRERGFTQRGAHRADWSLRFDRVVQREHLSRGQAKAIAMVCVLAQTRWLRDRIGEYPLLCLDDVGSELDKAHVAKVIAWLGDKSLQAWLTSTSEPDRSRIGDGAKVFHVEHSGLVPA